MLYIFLAILLLFTGCTKQQGTFTIEEGVLTVGVEVNYPPMEFYDTDGVTLLGFDIDLARALGEKLDLEVKFIDTAWEGILPGLNAGRFDVAVNVTILPERQERFNFTRPYIDSFITIVGLKDSQIQIDEPQDIAGYRVAFQGNTTAQYFTERVAAEGVRFSSFAYDKITGCFDDLKLRRIDLVAVDNIVAFFYAEKENDIFEVLWSGPADEYIALCLKKGNDDLTAALDAALEELFSDGTIAEIYRRYFGREMFFSGS